MDAAEDVAVVRKHRAPKGALRQAMLADSVRKKIKSESTERQKVH